MSFVFIFYRINVLEYSRPHIENVRMDSRTLDFKLYVLRWEKTSDKVDLLHDTKLLPCTSMNIEVIIHDGFNDSLHSACAVELTLLNLKWRVRGKCQMASRMLDFKLFVLRWEKNLTSLTINPLYCKEKFDSDDYQDLKVNISKLKHNKLG